MSEVGLTKVLSLILSLCQSSATTTPGSGRGSTWLCAIYSGWGLCCGIYLEGVGNPCKKDRNSHLIVIGVLALLGIGVAEIPSSYFGARVARDSS